MKQRILIVMTGVVLVAALGGLSASAQDKFKLKPGAKGKICLTCHATFQEKLKRAQVHTPVKRGECSGCHNPHTSSHDKLLDASTTKICSRCHNVVPEKAASTHRVAAEGTCTVCHDPHASDNPSVLLQRGDKLCYGCHDKIEQAVKQSRFKHVPVMQGCLTCHSPHASRTAPSLLKSAIPALCVGCHKTNTPLFTRQHMGYPVAESACTSCHNPHGSDKKGILHDNVHKPVAGRMCNQCHEEAGSPKPFALKKQGGELCRSCHSAVFNDVSLKTRVHWPFLSKEGCLSCHNPHASAARGLLKGPLVQLCGSCHADTTARMTQLKAQHGPVKDGFCVVCHQPHAADRTFLLNDQTIELCGTCHDWQTHVSHPMGEKVTDRRNRNLKVQCLSCHNAHGTDYKHMLLHTTVSEMCTQCHVEYRR